MKKNGESKKVLFVSLLIVFLLLVSLFAVAADTGKSEKSWFASFWEALENFFGGGITGAAVGTPISSCGVIPGAPNTVYTLSNDLTSTGTCLTFGQDLHNVTLDCVGHTIYGDGTGVGIDLDGWSLSTGLTIKNCRAISNFETGIRVRATPYITFDNNNMRNNVNGISFTSRANWNTLIDNTIRSNSKGVFFDSSSTGNVMNDNVICFNSAVDIQDDDANTGSNNNCDNTVNWNDAGATGCFDSCGLSLQLVAGKPPINGNVNGTNSKPPIEGGPVRPGSVIDIGLVQPEHSLAQIPGSILFSATPYSATRFTGSFNETFDEYANVNEAIWGCSAEGTGAPTTAGCGLGTAPGAGVGDKALSFDTSVLGPGYDIITAEPRIIFPNQDFEMEGVFYVDSATVPLDEGLVFGARLIDESTAIFADWTTTNLVLKKEFAPDLASAPIPIPQNTWVKVKLVFSAGRVKFFYATGPTKAITLPAAPTFDVPGTLGGSFSFLLGLHGSSTGMGGLVYWDDFLSTAVPNTGSVLLNAPAVTFEGVDYNELNQIIATGQGNILVNPACQDHPKFYLLPAVVDCLDLNEDLHTHAAVADLGVPVTLTVLSNGLTTASSEEALLNTFNLLESFKFAGIATDYEVKAQGRLARSVGGSLVEEPTPADADKLSRVGRATARPDGTFEISVTVPLDLGPNILFVAEGFEGEARLSQRIIYDLLPKECTAPYETYSKTARDCVDCNFDGPGCLSKPLCTSLDEIAVCNEVGGGVNALCIPKVECGCIENTACNNDADCFGGVCVIGPKGGRCSCAPPCTDNDGDGYAVEGGTCGPVDCDDTNAAVYPGAAEACNNVDDDCDGLIDEDLTQPCYEGPLGTENVGICKRGIQTCSAGVWGTCVGQVLPAVEICNGVDDDCDGLVDEGVKLTFYQDFDGDGYGDSAVSVEACTAPIGYVSQGGDCNDADPTINPGAAEACNGIDDNCDGVVPANEADSDLDGYRICENDCDDSESLINPGALGTFASEGAALLCDGIDNNCDGTVDDGCPICVADDEGKKKHFKTTKGTARTDDDSVNNNILTVRGVGYDGYKGNSADDVFVIVDNQRLNIKTDTIPGDLPITGIEIESTELVPLESNVIKKNSIKVDHQVLHSKDGDNLFAYSGRYFSLWDPFFSWIYTWDTATVDNSGDPDYAGFASIGITTSDRMKIHIDLKPLECKDDYDDDEDDDGLPDHIDNDDDDDGIPDDQDARPKDYDNDGKDDKDDDDDDNDGKKDHKDKHKRDKDKK